MSDITEEHRDILRKKTPLVWATIVPHRTTKGVVSLHRTAAHAKSAAKNAGFPKTGWRLLHAYDKARGGYPMGESEIYELVDGEWILRWQVPEGTYPNEVPWRS